MYNKISIMGRICNDLEIVTTPNGVPLLKFRVAVNRRYKAENVERFSDFFNVIAWRARAEHIQKYFKKGSMIFVEGSMQSRKYIDKNNIERTVWDVIVSDTAFTGEKKQQDVTTTDEHGNQELVDVYKNQSSESFAQETEDYGDEEYPF